MTKKTSDISQLILSANDKQIQQWLKKSDMYELTQLVCHNISDDAAETIHRNMSSRASALLSKDVAKAKGLVEKHTSLIDGIFNE